jgi:hypothetical protein
LKWRVAFLKIWIYERIDMKHFILLIGLLVFSLGIAGAQQPRTLENEAKAESSVSRKAVHEDYGTSDTRISEIQVGDLYTDGNREDYLKYVQAIMDYATEFEYYIQEIHVKDIAYLRGGNYDGYKSEFRIEEAVLPGDVRVVSVFAQLKTMEVVHHFSNKPFTEPHIRKVNEDTGARPGILLLLSRQAREAAAAIAQQKKEWDTYLDNVYKGAIAELQAAQNIMNRKRSPLLDNINRDIALLESHKKDHSLFYSKR